MLHPAPARSPRRPARAFTLIELLTVIAIVGILAAILIPVVGKVRAGAKQAACVSNLRQAMMATQMYAQDFRGLLPQHHGPQLIGSDTGGNFGWYTAVARHMNAKAGQQSVEIEKMTGRENIFVCPGGAESEKVNNSSYTGHYGTHHSSDYAVSIRQTVTFPWGTGTATATFANLNRVANPSRTIGHMDYPENAAYATSTDTFRTRLNQISKRHAERINVVFLAGNVRSFGIEELVATRQTNHPDYKSYWQGQ